MAQPLLDSGTSEALMNAALGFTEPFTQSDLTLITGVHPSQANYWLSREIERGNLTRDRLDDEPWFYRWVND